MPESTRIQLCGRYVARVDGRRVDGALPGRKGRLLFAYLALNRARPVPRDQLLMAVWGPEAPADAGPALSVTLSKLRAAVAPARLEGRSEVELALPGPVFVDADAAVEAAHRAEWCVGEERWADAWGPAGIAVHIAARPFLAGFDAPWIEDRRRQLEEVELRGLEAFAAAALGLGGPALRTAETAARRVVASAPFRESGHRLLIEALTARGNIAEAMRAYEALRVRLREELGIAPGPETQELHRRLLAQA